MFDCAIVLFLIFESCSADERRRDTLEKDVRDRQANPDHEAEDADDVDRNELAETFLPQCPEIRQHADREEGEYEEDHAERVGLADRRRDELRDVRRRAERKIKPDEERDDEADDEFWKPLPDFAGLSLVGVARNVD